MRKAILFVLLFSAVAANAGVIRYSAKHVAHATKKAAHYVYKVAY